MPEIPVINTSIAKPCPIIPPNNRQFYCCSGDVFWKGLGEIETERINICIVNDAIASWQEEIELLYTAGKMIVYTARLDQGETKKIERLEIKDEPTRFAMMLFAKGTHG